MTDRDDLISLIKEDDNFVMPNHLPLMPVRDVVIFTDMLLPLFVGREKSVRAVEEAVASDGFLFLATQKDSSIENPLTKDIYEVGIIARVLRMLKLPDGRIKALVHGVSKGKINSYTRKKDWYRVKIEIIQDPFLDELSMEVEALMRNVKEHSERILSLRGEFSGDIHTILDSITEPGKLADLVASNLRLKLQDAQQVLELMNPVERLIKVNEMLSREVALTAMQAKIQSEVREEISKTQRDHYLREQVRAIHRELGDSDDKYLEIEEFKKKIKKAKMPKEAEREAKKQLRRLEQMHPDSAETTITRTYLDWLVELPWNKSTSDKIVIKKAKEVLDRDHFALDKVKDRILEYLSVRKLNPAMKGSILCFTGPPGVGKTSLGRTIAVATERKFVRISLGGIRDEAEIRGHRRTYIGALPGRIIQGLKQCGSNNPVFIMDEIDKLGSDFRGDPSAALLEALDPEQNIEFSDHYLNIPFDLSKVMFILTANYTDTIPSALLDRMEIIYLPGYTEDEKQIIAEKFLMPRQISENGLPAGCLNISKNALLTIINHYTFEAGLRNLEREIASICRKAARKLAEDQTGPFIVNQANLHKYLGVPKFVPEMDQDESQVGLATGLAWTQVGGEVLYVECALIGGKGELIITGQIGEIMQESARAAVSYARVNLAKFGLDDNVFESLDIHIHVPAGAIPKDGPSAGVAMTVALISALTNTCINKYTAMTGEITLRGRILPVGGIKEKAMGAIRGGIKTMIIPEKNTKDLEEIPHNIRKKIKFIMVKHIDEVLPLVMEGDWPPPTPVDNETTEQDN